jgi:hypothetical protein
LRASWDFSPKLFDYQPSPVAGPLPFSSCPFPQATDDMTAFQDLLCELAQLSNPAHLKIGSEKRARVDQSDQLPVCRQTGRHQAACEEHIGGVFRYLKEIVPLSC